MSRVVKEMIIKEIEDRLEGNRDLLILDSSRLDAVTNNRFRLAMQEKGIHLLVVKNSLALRVLGDDSDQMRQLFEGPSTLAWGGEDIVALSKELTKQSRELDLLEIKGGTVEGQALDASAVEKLSKSPGRRELISMIAGQILSPGARLAGAMLGPGGVLAGCVASIAEKDDE